MRAEREPLVLAFDGGGTRCRAAAQADAGVVAVETGAANVSTDFDGAVREVERGIEALAGLLSRPVRALHAAPAFVGLAGVTGPAIAERLRAALPFRHARIADDRPAAVRGVLGRGDGLLAHCGTGSFFASQRDGEIRLMGGWGAALGDEASAQWVGRRALRFALEAEDGRLERSTLTERLLDRFGDSSGIVRFAGTAAPSQFGALAPLVTGLAESGDAIAVRVLQDGADEILRALRDLGWRPGLALCLTGGIGPFYEPYLPHEMRADLTGRAGEPIDGALSLARDLARDVDHARV